MKQEIDYSLAKFQKEIDSSIEWNNLPPARLLRVGPRGNEAKFVIEPPKKRGLVIALGKRDLILIAFPYGNAGAEGYHNHSEAYIDRAIGPSNIWTVMHGSIEKIGKGPEGKRTVFIYQMPKEDIEMIPDVCNSLTTRERGTIDPLHYLNGPNYVPQRIMQALRAQELKVISGIASASLFRLYSS